MSWTMLPRPRSRGNSWWPTRGQFVLIVAIWFTAALSVLSIATTTQVGYTLFKLGERYGVATGDALVAIAGGGGALLLTLWILWPRGNVWRPTLRQLVLVVVTWAAATAFVLAVAAVTDVGRVVFMLSENHGVHAGDVLASVVSFGGALVLTVWILWPRRRRWY
ncbi:MAG: hypothetical protein ACRDRK_15730 [Pseudonocardia sp.]